MTTSTYVYHLIERGKRKPFYTGKTADPYRRLSCHFSRARGNDRHEPVIQKIREVGEENVRMKIIASGMTDKQAGKMEQGLIASTTHVELGGTNVHRTR